MGHERPGPGAPSRAADRRPRATRTFVTCLLAVEFLDELVDGVYRAAWPLVRGDLNLSYVEIGVLLSVPGVVSAVLEVGIGVLGDVWDRRALVLWGGSFFALALLLTGVSRGFGLLLAAWVIFFVAGGAFVSLSQAALMDADPARREQNMARWTLSGSVANVSGPLLLGACVAAGAGWRGALLTVGALTVPVLLFARRLPLPTPARGAGAPSPGFAEGVRGALRLLRSREVVRWLLLLEASNLTLDALRDFLALYFVDVAGASEARAAWAVLVWTAAGLPGDALLLPLLERVRGLSYLRASAAATLVLLPLLLVVEGHAAKLLVVGLLGFSNAGWYSILQARLYAAMPGRSGAVMALGSVAGLLSYLAPLALGALADRLGLGATMWLLPAGPAVLLLGLLNVPAARVDARDEETP